MKWEVLNPLGYSRLLSDSNIPWSCLPLLSFLVLQDLTQLLFVLFFILISVIFPLPSTSRLLLSLISLLLLYSSDLLWLVSFHLLLLFFSFPWPLVTLRPPPFVFVAPSLLHYCLYSQWCHFSWNVCQNQLDYCPLHIIFHTC